MRAALGMEDVRTGAAAFTVEREDIDAAEERGLFDDTGRKIATRSTHGERFYRPGLTQPVLTMRKTLPGEAWLALFRQAPKRNSQPQLFTDRTPS